MGCDPFTGSAPLLMGGRNEPVEDGADAANVDRASFPKSVGFPKTVAEAAQRPIYTILDLKKRDAGAVDFGPIGLVFNRSRVDQQTVYMPVDTGGWSWECNATNRGKQHASNCCTSQVKARASPCDTCADNAQCCQDGHSVYNCSAWAEFYNAPGIVGHIDHILLAAARAWNDSDSSSDLSNAAHAASPRVAAERGFTPATNLATMLARSVATVSNYKSQIGPVLTPHGGYYIEANLIMTPQFGDGDVLFVIGQFPFLFGTARGRAFQSWAKKWNLPVVWGLGPEGCYEGTDQNANPCNTTEPTYRASQRFLDVESAASVTNLSAARNNPTAAAAFDGAWSRGAASRKDGGWNASVAWRALLAESAMTPFKVSPVSVGNCDTNQARMIAATLDGDCVANTARPRGAQPSKIQNTRV